MEKALNRKIKFCKVCGKVVFEDFRTIHPECNKERRRQIMKKWYLKNRKKMGIKSRYHSQRKDISITTAPQIKTQTKTLILIGTDGKARTFKLIGGN